MTTKHRKSGTRRRAEPSHEHAFEVAGEVARATRDYTLSLPSKMRALAAAIARARTGDLEALVVARSLAHRLHGTAGCYGFRELGTIAAIVDDHLATGDWGAVDRTMRDLEAAAVRRSA
jgi:HPt (histidine-containing phosphotransfer) domain-containing protein